MSDQPSQPKPQIVIVAAIAENNVIGVDGGLPWHLPEDLKHFKRTTLGCPIIMGRRTLDELGGKPLPKRRNIVCSRQPTLGFEGAEHATSLEHALEIAQTPSAEWPEPPTRLCIVGGAQIYAEALPIADVLELTTIHASPAGDTHFPHFREQDWSVSVERTHPADERHAHAMTFRTFKRAD